MKTVLRVKRKTQTIHLLNNLKFMSIYELIVYNTILFFHKIVMGKAPQYLTKKIRFNYEYRTRI